MAMGRQATYLLLVAVGCCCVSIAMAENRRAGAAAAFFETFGSGWTSRWHYSASKKYKGRFQVVQPPGFQDTAIKIPEASQHYGMTALLKEPLHAKDGLVVQYEAKFSEGHKCGGAYLKLLSAPADGSSLMPDKLSSKTPFTIMFGPDRCGPDARVHVILHTTNPAAGGITEHHLMSAPKPKEDLLSHVYALLLHTNGRFKVLIDGLEAAAGDLLTAKFSPPLQPPEVIPDPEDIKPEDWVEEEMMDDPSAEKPEGWDDRRMISDPHAQKPDGWLDHELPEIPDPQASKPDDWDEATLGVWLPPPIKNPVCDRAPGCGPWRAPLVSNPKYKGPWIPPQVKNPAYKGPWEQRQIPNPAYFKVDNPLDLLPPVAAVAFELWTTETGYTFDSVLLGSGDSGIAAAAAYMRDTWRPRNHAEKAAFTAAERAKSRPAGLQHLASNTLRDLLDHEALSSIRPQLGGLVWLLQEHPAMGWVLLVAPSVMVVALVMDRLTRRKEADEDDVADEQPELELEVDEQEVKRLSKQAADLQKQRQVSGGGRMDSNAAGEQQQQQQPDAQSIGQEEQLTAAAQPRRRLVNRRA